MVLYLERYKYSSSCVHLQDRDKNKLNNQIMEKQEIGVLLQVGGL